MRDQVRIYFRFDYIGWFVVSKGGYGVGTPFPLKWEILVILGIFAVFEKYIF
jgi:hypothetical protein